MVSTQRLHVVFAAYLGWGHVRPLCALAAKLVKLRDVDVTFLTSRKMHDKSVKGIARNLDDNHDALRSRVRVVALLAHDANPFDTDIIGKSFEEQLQKLLSGQPAFCAEMQAEVAALEPPNALIVDLYGCQFFRMAREASRSLKLIVSLPTSLFSIYYLTGPYDADLRSVLRSRVEELMTKTGKTTIEAANEIVFGDSSDKLIQVPGLPTVHDYENFPQQLMFRPPFIAYLHYVAPTLIQDADAIISASMAHIEPRAIIETFNTALSKTSRKIHFMGLLLPQSTREIVAERAELASSPEIASFMANALEKYGQRSVIYISFGTVYWTTQPDMAWTVLDVLLDRKIPFIMAHASPLCQVPEEVKLRVKTSGTGLVTPWAPQQAILEHPAIGWFLTHGGFNSITESIHAGVPMICWPFAGDQPLNTIHLTENLDVAYELLEVRTGAWDHKPVYRTGNSPKCTLDAVRAEAHAVLERAFGEDGARKRVNILKLRKTALELWKEGGAARASAEQLLDSISA